MVAEAAPPNVIRQIWFTVSLPLRPDSGALCRETSNGMLLLALLLNGSGNDDATPFKSDTRFKSTLSPFMTTLACQFVLPES